MRASSRVLRENLMKEQKTSRIQICMEALT